MKVKINIWHLFLSTLIIILILPVLWMILSSIKQEADFYTVKLFPSIHSLTFSNYTTVAEKIPLARYLLNTLFVAISITIAKLITSLLAAYGFARFNFKYRDFIFMMCIFTIFVPIQITMIPNYLLIAKIHWLNTFPGIIVPQLADAMGIFLLRQTIKSVPASIFDSALVDGANHIQILLKVLLPIIKPAFIALGALFFINAWNEYYWPFLIISDKSMYTMPLALQLFTSQEGGTQWGIMMATATITALPTIIIYAFFQKYIISGFIKSNIKG